MSNLTTYIGASLTATALQNDFDAKKAMVHTLIQDALLHLKVDRQDYANEVCRIHIQILNSHLLHFKVSLVQKYREPLKHTLRTEAETLTTAGYQVIQHSSESFYLLIPYSTPTY